MKKQNQRKSNTLHMVFGIEAIEALHDKDIDKAIEIIKKGRGEYKRLEFKTKTELAEYVMKLEENNGWKGWNEYGSIECSIPDDFVKETIQKFENAFNN